MKAQLCSFSALKQSENIASENVTTPWDYGASSGLWLWKGGVHYFLCFFNTLCVRSRPVPCVSFSLACFSLSRVNDLYVWCIYALELRDHDVSLGHVRASGGCDFCHPPAHLALLTSLDLSGVDDVSLPCSISTMSASVSCQHFKLCADSYDSCFSFASGRRVVEISSDQILV